MKRQSRQVGDSMAQHAYRRVGFRVGISTLFAFMLTVAILGITGFVYYQNSATVREIAYSYIRQSSDAMLASSAALFDPVNGTVESLAGVGDVDSATLRRPEMLKSMLRTIQLSPEFYSLFIAFADDGSLTEVIRIPTIHNKVEPNLAFGPNHIKVPEGAFFVERSLHRPAGGPATDEYQYLSNAGAVLGSEIVQNPVYDPREQDYFKAALAAPKNRVISDLMPYDTSAKVGVAVVRAFSSGGKAIGVVGGYISLDKFSYFLRHNQPVPKEDATAATNSGIAMILDDKGQLVAHPDPSVVADYHGTTITVHHPGDLDNVAVRAALPGHQLGVERRIYTAPDGKEYVASFKPFPDSFGKRWEILLIVPTEDFVGGINATTQSVLIAAVVLILAGILFIRWFSAALTKPIEKLILETQRIRKFELSGELILPSRIREIADLVDATAAMKTALGFVSNFMPKQIVRDLLATGRGIDHGGESRVITVMFTDLASFSTLAEKVTPDALTERVSDYLDVVTKEAIKTHGVIDKYIGDAVMALWNAPDLDPDHIAHACQAALGASAALQASNKLWAKKGWDPLKMRVGLHTDRVIVGVIGSTDFVSYTALGDGVNIASRLEGINKDYGTLICVSHPIYLAVSDRFLMRPMDFVAVKGRKEPILIYELMATLGAGSAYPATPAQMQLATLTAEAFAAWTANDYRSVVDKLRQVLEHFPGDKLAELYMSRCAAKLIERRTKTERRTRTDADAGTRIYSAEDGEFDLIALTADAFQVWAAGNYSLAQEKYQTLLDHYPGDPVATAYVKRAAEAVANGASAH